MPFVKYFSIAIIGVMVLTQYTNISDASESKRPSWCKPGNKTKINIIPTTDDIKYDYTQNLVELSKQQVDTESPYAKTIPTHTSGLMSGEIKISAKVVIGEVGRKRRCLYFDEITVKVHISPTIFIANDYEMNGCMHDEIMKHEHTHVEVDRALVNKYARKVGKRILKIIDETPVVGPMEDHLQTEMTQKMVNHVQTSIQYVRAQLLDERNRRQNLVDSLEEYQKIEDQGLCMDERKKIYSSMSKQR